MSEKINGKDGDENIGRELRELGEQGERDEQDETFVIVDGEQAREICMEYGDNKSESLANMTPEQIENRMAKIRFAIGECLECYKDFAKYFNCDDLANPTDEEIECSYDGIGDLLTDLQDFVTTTGTLAKEYKMCSRALKRKMPPKEEEEWNPFGS